MADYYGKLLGTRILHADRSVQGDDDTNVTQQAFNDPFVYAAQIGNNGKDTVASAYKLQWRLAGGTWADLGATGALKYTSSTVLSNGTALIQANAKCTAPGDQTWQNGEEVEDGQSASIDLGSDCYTEIQFAVDPSGADFGNVFEFRVWGIAENAVITTVTGAWATVAMVNKRYWVANTRGGGYWIQEYLSEPHWATSSGGEASWDNIPGDGDTVVFDENSIPEGSPDLYVVINDTDTDVRVAFDTTNLGAGRVTFKVDANCSLELLSDFEGWRGIRIDGTFKTNGYNVSLGQYFHLGTYGTGSADIGASTITIGPGTGTDAYGDGNYNTDYRGMFSFDAGAKIVIDASDSTSALPFRIYLDGVDVPDVEITMEAATNLVYLTGGYSFDTNVTMNSLSVAGDGVFKPTHNMTITNGLTLEGDTSGGLVINSYSVFIKASGIVKAINCTLKNSTASGGATFRAPLSSGNVNDGGNTGWSFANDIESDIPLGQLQVTGYPPLSDEISIIPLGNLIIAGYAPSIAMGGTKANIPLGALLVTGYDPTATAFLKTIAPIGGILLEGYPPVEVMRAQVSLAELLLSAYAPAVRKERRENIPAGSIELVGLAPTSQLCISRTVPCGALDIAAFVPRLWWEPSAAQVATLQTIYLCVLTGAADGLADLLLPISSFQSIIRSDSFSYLSVVVPNSIDYAAGILARTNGDIVIRKGYRFSDGTTQTEEICRAAYANLQIARGGRRDSAILSGYKAVEATASKVVSIAKVRAARLQANGKRVLEGAPDLFLRVGDTASDGTESFVVGEIDYSVGGGGALMKVVEA
jgi:hypothetical protein